MDRLAAAKQWDAYAVAYANAAISTSNPGYICEAAVTYEKTGQSAKACVLSYWRGAVPCGCVVRA